MEKTKKPWLIVMCGLAGSGKSTLAKKIAAERNAEIISSDELRKEMFGDETHQEDKNKLFTEYNKRIRTALERGSDVIADKNRFSKGDIVYWCEREGGRYTVRFGVVEDQYSDGVYINFLELRERRRIDGIPLDEFRKTCHLAKYKKLPKDWSYDTLLYELTSDPWLPEEEQLVKELKITDPKQIKEAYDRGILVEKEKIFKGDIYTDITNEGYKIMTKYSLWGKYEPKSEVVRSDKVYFTCEEAIAERDTKIAELKRPTALFDEEWSLEQIEKDVRRYLHIYFGVLALEQDKVDKYMNFFKELPKVEDIETRLFGGMLQWKYYKNKTWKNVFIPD